MTRLEIVKLRLTDNDHLVEHRLLLEETVARAREIDPDVELRLLDPAATLPRSRAEQVLILGAPGILLTARSLRAMTAACTHGFEWVGPARLSDFDALAEDPVFTLRGFERIEDRVLENGLEPRSHALSHLPVSVLSAALYDRTLAGRPAGELAAASPEVEQTIRSAPSARRGLFHEFSDYYGQVRDDVLPFVPADTSTVLEVGCGRGGTAELLERRLGCRVTGVELNPVIAAQARGRITGVYEGDVETLALEGVFDLVLALEVIEHLVDPAAFLRKARSLTRPGGRIVLSTPNVGHYAVVEDLQSGRWDYIPSGAMCYTHLRFFTRSTLESLLRRAGLLHFQIEPQLTPLPARWSATAATPLPDEDVRFAPDRDSLATLAFYVIIHV